MTGASHVWSLRALGTLASAALIVILLDVLAAIRPGSWLAIPDLAALELTVLLALAIAASATVHRGRSALQLDGWARSCGWRGLLERFALIWCMSLMAVLGVLPGLALDLGPPALWPVVVIALATLAARVASSEPARRVAWLLCTSYGLTAAVALVTVRRIL